MITICDTGPIVAYLNRNDPYHAWAVAVLKDVRRPMLTSEPVMTEAACILRADGTSVDPLFELLERGALRLDFELSAHWTRVRTLMARYARMDLARCVDRGHDGEASALRVLTVDRRDFSSYRRNDRQVIDFVAPPARQGVLITLPSGVPSLREGTVQRGDRRARPDRRGPTASRRISSQINGTPDSASARLSGPRPRPVARGTRTVSLRARRRWRHPGAISEVPATAR